MLRNVTPKPAASPLTVRIAFLAVSPKVANITMAVPPFCTAVERNELNIQTTGINGT